MKPMLTKAAPHPLYYYRSGMRIEGPHPELLGGVTGLRGDASELWGDASELWGDVTGLRGNVTGIWGDVTDLRGNVTGLRGNVTGLRGDLDACEITDAERKSGIDVATLVQQPAAAVPGGYALVRCPNCWGTGEVCTRVIDGIPELFECGRCAGTGAIPAPKSAAALAEPCEMGAMCLNCQPERKGRSTDMTDHELLKLAAKAAGIELRWHPDGTAYSDSRCKDYWGVWNPIADDGDAQRLSVKCNLNVCVGYGSVSACLQDDGSFHRIEETKDDPYAATRRAIVRTAAEIGRSMK